MKALLETVLYKRSPEELEKICKDVNASKSWRITYNGKLTYYALFNSVTRKRKYKWEKESLICLLKNGILNTAQK